MRLRTCPEPPGTIAHLTTLEPKLNTGHARMRSTRLLDRLYGSLVEEGER